MKNFHSLSPGRTGFYHDASADHHAPVAVSACLAGEPVRYDGRDRRHPAIDTALRQALQLIPVCPEVGAGLGVPRPPVQLVRFDGDDSPAPRAVGRDDPALDVSDDLRRYALGSLRQLRGGHPLCGYLWKSRSPSCGLNSTPVFSQAGEQIGVGSGIQAQLFQRHLPWLAHCEESLLQTEADAHVFIWRCRLVFDVMYAGQVQLADLDRHYRRQLPELFARLPASSRSLLDTAVASQRPRRYLAILHSALGNARGRLPPDLFG